MQLIVLGMHRSGTSVLARLLNLMGAYFGPEGSSTGANHENPKGFWERRDVRNLNDQVLHAMGCDWNRISAFDPEAIPEAVAADFNRAAAPLVLDLDAHRPWLLKEPRLCLLFGLWRPLLEVPVCVHVLRHPVEVAASLLRRNGIPIEAGLALWEKYVRVASDSSAGLPAVTVSHHALMTEPVREVGRLHAGLERHGVRGLREPEPAEVEAFVKPGLYRERQERDDLAPYASSPQVKLFADLVERRSTTIAGRNQVSAKSRRALLDYEAGLPTFQPPRPAPPAPAVDRKTLDALRAELSDFGRKTTGALEALARNEKDQARQSAELVAAHNRELKATREAAATAKARLERDVAKLREAAEASKAAVEATKAAAAASKAKLEREAADLRAAAAASRAAAAEAKSQLDESRRSTREALEEAARQSRAFGELQERARQERDARDREIAQLQVRVGEADAALATAARKRAMLESEVNARVRDIGVVAGLLLDTARAERSGKPDAEQEERSDG